MNENCPLSIIICYTCTTGVYYFIRLIRLMLKCLLRFDTVALLYFTKWHSKYTFWLRAGWLTTQAAAIAAVTHCLCIGFRINAFTSISHYFASYSRRMCMCGCCFFLAFLSLFFFASFG